jgi:outer membrane protein assembly factor BamB
MPGICLGQGMVLAGQNYNCLVVNLSDGTVGTFASGLPNQVAGYVATSSTGTVLMTSAGYYSPNSVLELNSSGTIINNYSTGTHGGGNIVVIGTTAYITGIHEIVSLNLTNGTVRSITNTHLAAPEGLAAGLNGDLYFTDFFTYSVYRVDISTGTVTTIRSLPYGQTPYNTAFDSAGNMYIATHGGITRLTSGVDGILGTADDVAFDLISGVEVVDLACDNNRLYFLTIPHATNSVLSYIDLSTEQQFVVTNFSEKVYNMTLTSIAIPEPATTAGIAGLAALGVAVYRRRRRAA